MTEDNDRVRAAQGGGGLDRGDAAGWRFLDVLTGLFDAYRRFYSQEPDLPGARRFLEARLRGPESAVLLAVPNDAPGTGVGFAQLYPSFSSVSMKPIWILNDLFVAAHARRFGVGRLLLASACEFAQSTGVARLRLSTAKDNVTAKALHLASGYRMVEFDQYDMNWWCLECGPRQPGVGRRDDPKGATVVYPAKCDWWIACLAVPSGLLSIGIGAFIAWQAVGQAVPPVPGLVGTVLLLLVGGLLLWMFMGTSYEIGEAELVCRLGPFRFRAPLNAIEEVVSTSGFCLVFGLGLSWSMDMLHVKYRKPSGRRAWPVSISPQNKAAFLQELAAAVPGLKILGDGCGE